MTEGKTERYLGYLTGAIQAAALNPPQLGTGRPVTVDEFGALYGGDPFYSWLGFDTPLLYRAHHAAAAMTSLYRKLGDGCQDLWRAIIRDQFKVEDLQARWSYTIPKSGGVETIRELDGYIDILDFPDTAQLAACKEWLKHAKEVVSAQISLRGIVFEVRQGYKSQDAKRSTGDVDNGTRIALQGCLPTLVVFSNQLPPAIATRYASAGWIILRGVNDDDPFVSTFAFAREVMGFDLADFFEVHSKTLRKETERVLKALLGDE